jgi:dipeptidyl-peptidase 4
MHRSAAIAAAFAAVSHLSDPVHAEEDLTPARVFASPDLSGPRARGVQMAPDGSAVTYLKTKPDDISVTDLWITEVADGTSQLLMATLEFFRRTLGAD